MLVNRLLLQNSGVSDKWKLNLLPPFRIASTTGQMPMDRGIQEVGGSVEAEMIKVMENKFPEKVSAVIAIATLLIV